MKPPLVPFLCMHICLFTWIVLKYVSVM
uniref:Uncharacterized protein n=1 Tax=Rhizophora mucronata TaxID=61149 RepID=A0A2P2P877_RHIMU